MRRRKLLAASAAAAVLPWPARAEETPGVTPPEIRLGNTVPYSGPAAAYSSVGIAQTAYMDFVNDQGGVGGRKLRLISLDNEYSPPKALENTRRLVEQEGVLAIVGTLGTPTNAAIQKYLNEKGIPQLFCVSGASRWGDPEHFPWTIGLVPTLRKEGSHFARYILANHPAARIAVLYQNDDFGKEELTGLMDGFGEKAGAAIVARASYDMTDAVVDSQITTLRGSGADALMLFTTAKHAALAIRTTYNMGWRPLRFLSQASGSIKGALVPAGLDKAAGVIGAGINKDPNDPQWAHDQGRLNWATWMAKYVPHGDPADEFYVTGYNVAQLMVQVLRQCDDDLTRMNVMRQVTNLDLELPMLLPGIRVHTSQTDFFPIKQTQLRRFTGAYWESIGGVIGN